MSGKIILRCMAGFLIFFVNSSSFAIGEKYSKQGKNIGKIVYQKLIEVGYCIDIKDCHKKRVLFGEDGDRVHLNIYGITDRKVISEVVSMVVEDGIVSTGGVPISLHFYFKNQDSFLGFNAFFKSESILVEVNE